MMSVKCLEVLRKIGSRRAGFLGNIQKSSALLSTSHVYEQRKVSEGNLFLHSVPRNSYSSMASPKKKLSGTDGNATGSSSAGENNQVQKIPINIPWTGKIPKMAYLLTNILSADECQRFIDMTKQIGYHKTPIGNDSTTNSQCVWDSLDETARFWEKIKNYTEEVWYADTQTIGLRERMYFHRYQTGEHKPVKSYGTYIAPNGDRSYVRIEVFLNDNYEGGVMSLVSPPTKDGYLADVQVEITAKPGSALVYQHDIYNEISQVVSGEKYTVAMEVMSSLAPLKKNHIADSARNFYNGQPVLNCAKDEVISPTSWFVPPLEITGNTKPTLYKERNIGIPFCDPVPGNFGYNQ